jgi:hypothetical protein
VSSSILGFFGLLPRFGWVSTWALVHRFLGCKDVFFCLVRVRPSLCFVGFYCPLFEYTMIDWHEGFFCSNYPFYRRICYPVTSGRHFR